MRIEDWVCSPYGGSSGKTLVSWEIELGSSRVEFRELVA